MNLWRNLNPTYTNPFKHNMSFIHSFIHNSHKKGVKETTTNTNLTCSMFFAHIEKTKKKTAVAINNAYSFHSPFFGGKHTPTNGRHQRFFWPRGRNRMCFPGHYRCKCGYIYIYKYPYPKCSMNGRFTYSFWSKCRWIYHTWIVWVWMAENKLGVKLFHPTCRTHGGPHL